MNDKIKGIIIDGKVYKAVEGHPTCKGCHFHSDRCELVNPVCSDFYTGEENDIIFKFSQELTDKLNKQ